MRNVYVFACVRALERKSWQHILSYCSFAYSTSCLPELTQTCQMHILNAPSPIRRRHFWAGPAGPVTIPTANSGVIVLAAFWTCM